jgi:hypothetical protein
MLPGNREVAWSAEIVDNTVLISSRERGTHKVPFLEAWAFSDTSKSGLEDTLNKE